METHELSKINQIITAGCSYSEYTEVSFNYGEVIKNI